MESKERKIQMMPEEKLAEFKETKLPMMPVDKESMEFEERKMTIKLEKTMEFEQRKMTIKLEKTTDLKESKMPMIPDDNESGETKDSKMIMTPDDNESAESKESKIPMILDDNESKTKMTPEERLALKEKQRIEREEKLAMKEKQKIERAEKLALKEQQKREREERYEIEREERLAIKEQQKKEREEKDKILREERLVIKEKRKREREERDKIEATERKEAALTQMRYLLSVCEQYSDIFKKTIADTKMLKDKNTFQPTIDDIKDVQKEVKSKKIKKDFDVSKHLKYFTGTLHPYQVEGVTWMYMLCANASNGILADEMGLGKTVQVIALICVLLEQNTKGPFLIVAPLSTIPNWQSEFERFAPQVPVVCITGSAENRQTNLRLMSKKYKIGNFETYPVVVVSYQTPLLEFKAMDKLKWRYIIVDEGQRIKNHESQLAVRLRQFRSENRLLLSGTPLQNNIVELWALLNFLLPNFFGNMSTFTDIIMMEDLQDADKMIMQEQSNNLVSKIHKVLTPFMLRRLKKDVLKNMVPKKEVTVYCPMSPLQMKLYDLVIEKNIAGLRCKPDEDKIDVDEPRAKRKCSLNRDYTYTNLDQYIEQSCLADSSSGDISDSDVEGLIIDKSDIQTSNKELKKFNETIIRLTMQNSMMMFRKIVNHPYLVHFPLDPNSEKKQLLINEDLIKCSGKLLVLDTLLPELKKRGHKVLLFSQLTMGLDLIEEYMLLRGYNYRRLDGSYSLEQRADNMKEFNTDSNVFIFLLSTKAGGLGLNLTGADTVIFFDRDWNPQVDIQAQDRCHRIGQTKPVVIYTLTTKNTCDEHIVATGKLKRVLEKVVISDGKFKTITAEDRTRTEDILIELRKALKEPEDDDCYIFSNDLELNRLLDRSDLYALMKEAAKQGKSGNKENRT